MKVIKAHSLGEEIDVLVDDENFEELNHFRWNLKRHPGVTYVVRPIRLAGKTVSWIKMHRQILNQTDPHKLVDHINHDGLDNRKQNLTVCTQSQNKKNYKVRRNGYKGIAFTDDKKRYRARIMSDGKLTNLGTFDTELEAAVVYDFYATLYHGQFACLNFPLSKAR